MTVECRPGGVRVLSPDTRVPTRVPTPMPEVSHQTSTTIIWIPKAG